MQFGRDLSNIDSMCSLIPSTEKPGMKVATLKDVTANAGEQVELYLEISGSPAPTVEWTKGTTKVTESERIQIVSTPNDATLVIMKCARGDTSEYTVSISNKHGSEKASVKVKIIGGYSRKY